MQRFVWEELQVCQERQAHERQPYGQYAGITQGWYRLNDFFKKINRKWVQPLRIIRKHQHNKKLNKIIHLILDSHMPSPDQTQVKTLIIHKKIKIVQQTHQQSNQSLHQRQTRFLPRIRPLHLNDQVHQSRKIVPHLLNRLWNGFSSLKESFH